MKTLVCALLLFGTGCDVIEGDDPAVGVDENELLAANKLAANKLAANKLAANKLAANKLAANKLAANKLAANSLSTQGLISTADGREVMSYIVGCALPTGASVTLSDPSGTAYTFPGWIGVAPGWATAAPTIADRRWVTACLLARTNLYGVSVQISMRHDTNPALAATSDEIQTFDNVEAAFFGDLFAPTPELFVCARQSFTNSSTSADSLRACSRTSDGVTSECGFAYAGFCTGTFDGRSAACADRSAPYRDCAGNGTTYAETITIYLPDDTTGTTAASSSKLSSKL